jgi:hypothetical protein
MSKEKHVKVFAMLPQRPDVTNEYFHEHWIHPHGTWSLDMKPLRRYVQSHRIGSAVDGAEPSVYEGIAIVWFDDLEAALTMGDDPVYKAKVQPDEPLFIDMSGLAFVMTDEHLLRVGPPVDKDHPEGAKVMLLLSRGDRAPEEFSGDLLSRGDSIAAAAPTATRVALAISDPVNYADGAEPACDAVLELWYPDGPGFEESWSTEGKAVIDALGEGVGVLGDVYREVRLIWPDHEGAA